MRLASVAIIPCLLVSAVVAADPVAVINLQIAAQWERDEITPAKQCSDRTFVRRVYLDLAGRVPTVVEVDEFLKDGRDSRREHLIDLLLQSEDHAQHFADLFDVLLMGRTEENTYDERAKHGWRKYLESVFRENRPWDAVSREILLARPRNEDTKGSIWFLYERENKHQAIAEAVAPAFFGMRIECAQCHNHMMADEIKQAHYWGLVAFFNRSKNKDTSSGPRMAESAIGGFSEFANLEGSSTPNFLTFFGAPTIDEDRPGKDEKQKDSDELYVSADNPDDPREPIFSRRNKFVTRILDGHPLLARAMVNRVWAILMGRGIVHPYDEIDSMHPPSHPELLDWLSDDYAASGFDTRRLVRSITLSDAYQLNHQPPDESTPPSSFSWYLERPLTAEQLARSIQLVLRGFFENDAVVVKTLRQQILDVLPDAIEVPIDDALFFTNNGRFDEFIQNSIGGGHLLGRVARCESAQERTRLLIETVFGRPPTEEESNAISEYLNERGDRLETALGQVAWALITSAEFRFNH